MKPPTISQRAWDYLLMLFAHGDADPVTDRAAYDAFDAEHQPGNFIEQARRAIEVKRGWTDVDGEDIVSHGEYKAAVEYYHEQLSKQPAPVVAPYDFTQDDGLAS